MPGWFGRTEALKERVAAGTGHIQEDISKANAVEEYLLKLTSETDPARMLAMVAETAAKLIGAETLVVPLLIPDNSLVKYEYAYGKHSNVFLGMALPIENAGLCGWVLENRKPILCIDLMSDPRVKKELAKALDLECAVLVPLISRGNVIGGISAFNKIDKTLFTDDDTAVLSRFANFAAVAVDNARLMEEYRQIARQNELILNSASEGIYGLDLDGKITFMNAASAAMLGYGTDELIGRESHPTWHHKHADGRDYPASECTLLAALKSGTTRHESEDVFWRKDGTSIPVEYTSTPIFDGKFLIGSVVSFRDISERKQAVGEIQKRVKDLEKFSKLTVGRELRIAELKKEVDTLKAELARYKHG